MPDRSTDRNSKPASSGSSSLPTAEVEDLPNGLQVLFLFAEYARLLIRRKSIGAKAVPLNLTGQNARLSIPLQFRAEMETLTSQIVRAWNNRVRLDFSMAEVATALKSPDSGTRSQSLREKFAGAYPRNSDGSFPLEDKPTTFIDREDRVVAWYIPGAFGPRRCVETIEVVSCYGDVLQARGDQKRDAAEHFANPSKCVVMPGRATFSISCYDKGHGPHDSLPAPSMTTGLTNGRELLSKIRTLNALIGALFSIVHPDYFDKQMEVLWEIYSNADKKTQDPALTREIFEHWSTIFSAIAVISNRERESHRDNQGGMFELDVLVTLGEYDGCRFEVPLLGRRFMYGPGTAFVLPARLMEHGVSKANGERVCIASFFRPAVGQAAMADNDYYPLPPTARSLELEFNLMRPTVDDKDIWN